MLASRRAARRAWLLASVFLPLVYGYGNWAFTRLQEHGGGRQTQPTRCIDHTMPSADEFDTYHAASQQNQHCKSTDVSRSRADAPMQERCAAPRRETIDSVMAMLGLSCRREVEASLDWPRNELSLPCKQEVQNALSGFSHVRARRPQYTVFQ